MARRKAPKVTKEAVDAELVAMGYAADDLSLLYSIAAGDEDEDAPCHFCMSSAQEAADEIAAVVHRLENSL